MKFTHFSNEPLSVDTLRNGQENNTMKPNGLWLSVDGDDDWEAWCKAERFNFDRYRWRQEIVLHDSATVLVLDTVDKIKQFDAEYHLPLSAFKYHNVIDWSTVMKEYDGLIIAPYQWSLRMSECLWYYSWDCASGCIWNAAAIVADIGEPQPINWGNQEDVTPGVTS